MRDVQIGGEQMAKQKEGWCDEHGHETVQCMKCGEMWCPEPGHGCKCPREKVKS